MMRVRVAFLLPTLEVGGAERVVLRTAMMMDRDRFDPVVVAIVRGNGNLGRELDAAGIETVVLDDGARSRRLQLHRLFRWMRNNRPDVLLTYMFHANIAGRLMKRLGAVSAVVGSERSAGLDPGWRVFLDRCTVGWTDAISVNSMDGRGFWSRQLRVPEDQLTLIHNGVDTAAFSPGAPVKRLLIGVLARLHHVNGHDWLLDALARLETLASGPWRCVFAGSGAEEPALRAKVEDLELTHRVEFVGHVADPASFLRSLMLCVHPSHFAGMPNAVLEAMACGLPVIGTAVGGTPEVIEHGRTGWLVQPGDAAATATLLAELLRAPELRAKVGAAARAKVERDFSQPSMVSQTEALVTRVLKLES